MYFAALRAAIKTKLDALVPATLGVVLNGEQFQQLSDIGAWPAAELVRGSIEPDYLTNREDFLTHVFIVNVYQQLPDGQTASVETAMDSVMDTVMAAFQADLSLGGVADGRILPLGADAGVIAWQGKLVRRDTIVLKCRKVKSF